MKNALVFAFMTLVGYALVCLGMAFMVSGEVLPGLATVGLLASPIACLLGAAVGGLMHKARSGKIFFAGFVFGLCLPVVGYFAAATFTRAEHNRRNSALHREAERALQNALADGFPFPVGVKPFLPGDVRSSLQADDVVKFYDAATKPDWRRHDIGGSVWYVRPSKAKGMTDQIQVKSEYRQTSIYFGTYGLEDMQLRVASAFGNLVKRKDWVSASKLCTPELQKQLGPNALKSMFTDVEPSSSAFVRKHMPNGHSTPIGINAHQRLGPSTTQSGEVGLELTDDFFPRIKRVEY